MYTLEMHADFEQSRALTTRELHREDWSLIRDHFRNVHGDEWLAGFLDGKNPDDPSSWQNHMDHYSFFGLFYGDRLVGTTAILFRSEGEAVFTGSLIAEGYKGKGYADYLYEVRKKYLREQDFKGRVITEIMEPNKPSLKAALRNGFEVFSEENIGGKGWSGRMITLELQS